MRLSGRRIAALSIVYLLIYAGVSGAAFERRAAQARRQHGGGDFIYGEGIPGWWIALLVLPPLLLVGWWAWTGRRS
jgi:hypothetical protein